MPCAPLKSTVGSAAAAQSFVAGQNDAAMTYEPYLSTVRDNPDAGKIIATTLDYPVVMDSVGCTPEFIELMRRHRAAVVVADTAGRWPLIKDVTANFVYVRLHGDVELYYSGYGRAALKRWAERVRAWSEGGEAAGAQRIARPAAKRRSGRDVYVYFDNDAKVHAPFDAIALRRLLKLEGATRALERGTRALKPHRALAPAQP